MLFRHRKPKAHEAAPLSRWALSQRGSDSELVRAYGAEHAEELGPLGWVFRAIESVPREIPSLGQWQRFERGLRERLAIMPPPTTRMAGFLPLAFIPKIQTPDLNQVVGDLVWKATAVAAATTVITFHLVSSGALADLGERLPHREGALLTVAAVQPTQAIQTHLERTRSALETPASAGSGAAAAPGSHAAPGAEVHVRG